MTPYVMALPASESVHAVGVWQLTAAPLDVAGMTPPPEVEPANIDLPFDETAPTR